MNAIFLLEITAYIFNENNVGYTVKPSKICNKLTYIQELRMNKLYNHMLSQHHNI